MYPARRRGLFHQQIITAIQLQFQHYFIWKFNYQYWFNG